MKKQTKALIVAVVNWIDRPTADRMHTATLFRLSVVSWVLTSSVIGTAFFIKGVATSVFPWLRYVLGC